MNHSLITSRKIKKFILPLFLIVLVLAITILQKYISRLFYADQHHTDVDINKDVYISGQSQVGLPKTELQGPQLVAIINDGYVNITYNWLCHTANLSGIHDRVHFIVEDYQTLRRLQERWPNIKTTLAENSSVSMLGELKYETTPYKRLMVHRTKLIKDFMDKRKSSFFLFETDFIWYKNPTVDMLDLSEQKSLDIVGTETGAISQKVHITCAAFLYFRNNLRTRKLWSRLTDMMISLESTLNVKGKAAGDDQEFLNQLLRAKFAGILAQDVSYNVVADGQWYNLTSKQRQDLNASFPKALHNNWIIGASKKTERFKLFNQWVLNEDGSCNDKKVKMLMGINELFQP